MDTDDGGIDRYFSDDTSSYAAAPDYGAETLVRANIPWRGSDAKTGVKATARNVTPLAEKAERAKRESDAPPPLDEIIIGSSRLAQTLRETIEAYAATSAPVLITGETGVGKELVATELHRRSERGRMPFVALNAGAIPTGLASSELFGHKKGAFTGAHADQIGAIAAADGGVLFLDEIGDMPLEIQAQLLRVLDDGMVTKVGARTGAPVDFRLIAATNVDLRRNVMNGTFRRDLYHRLDVLVVDVPPLRERGDDVIEIGEALIGALSDEALRGAVITPKAADRLKTYAFPGNVRELRNVLTRAAVRARGGKILPEHITFSEFETGGEVIGFDVSQAQDLVARYLIIKALLATDGNVSKAAKLTGRGRTTIHEFKKQLKGEEIAAEYEAVCMQMRALVNGC